MKARKRLFLIELNEINFDYVEEYFHTLDIPSFRKIVSGKFITTASEKDYEKLEPWIQWPSIHTGCTADEHGVFRLGDIVGTPNPQIFEQLEQLGLKVGCISAMNAENRLSKPAYFIPDPWTKTPSDGSWWSRRLAQAISQAVNDNSQARLTAKSVVSLALGLARFAQLKNYGLYLSLATRSLSAPWRKALLLDLLLHDLHLRWSCARKPAFSTLFLNAGAHIQHHYFFNAEPVQEQTALRNPSWYVDPQADPFADMLLVYDRILGDLLKMEDAEVIVATGLAQCPYDRLEFYWRLKDHAAFLKHLGIAYRRVYPRMTRDFLIEFDEAEQAFEAQSHLESVCVAGRGESLFGAIDNRGRSLFVTLTYPKDIDDQLMIEVDGVTEALKTHVAFVGIKNGMHQSEGYAYFSPGIAPHAPKDGAHVKDLHETVLRYFECKPQI